MRDYPAHDAFYTFMEELNHTYLSHSALWADDYNHDGFAWLDCHQEERFVYVIERRSKEETLIAAFNFSRKEQSTAIESTDAQLTVLLNTDWEKYGGNTPEEQTKAVLQRGTATLTLPPFSGMLFASH